ncbi:MAG: hypothetical protein V1706_00550 [Pseudomonadota bacterium]
MKATAISRTRSKAAANVAVLDKVALGSIAFMGGISLSIGIWSGFCLAAAFVANGPVGMMKGFVTALTGV